MKIIIDATAKEAADLILEIQGQRCKEVQTKIDAKLLAQSAFEAVRDREINKGC